MRRHASLLLLCASLPASAQHAGQRSRGYGGSTPPGQISTALASLDCARINKTPGLSRMAVPLSDECTLVIPSPNGDFTARAEQGVLSIAERKTGRLRRIRAFEQPVEFRWSSDSRAFYLNDGEGSGQVSRFIYFHRAGRRWLGSRAFDRAAEAAFLKRYDCRGGRNSYANVSGFGWTSGGRFRAIVTEGVHSEGCLAGQGGRYALLEVIGNPATGKIFRTREVSRID